MADKILFVLFAVLFVTQVVSSIPLDKEENEQGGAFGKEIEKTIDGTLSNWKEGIDNFFKNGIQADRMFQDLTGNIQTFSTNVAGAGKSFVQHLQGKTDTMIDKMKTQ